MSKETRQAQSTQILDTTLRCTLDFMGHTPSQEYTSDPADNLTLVALSFVLSGLAVFSDEELANLANLMGQISTQLPEASRPIISEGLRLTSGNAAKLESLQNRHSTTLQHTKDLFSVINTQYSMGLNMSTKELAEEAIFCRESYESAQSPKPILPWAESLTSGLTPLFEAELAKEEPKPTPITTCRPPKTGQKNIVPIILEKSLNPNSDDIGEQIAETFVNTTMILGTIYMFMVNPFLGICIGIAGLQEAKKRSDLRLFS